MGNSDSDGVDGSYADDLPGATSGVSASSLFVESHGCGDKVIPNLLLLEDGGARGDASSSSDLAAPRRIAKRRRDSEESCVIAGECEICHGEGVSRDDPVLTLPQGSNHGLQPQHADAIRGRCSEIHPVPPALLRLRDDLIAVKLSDVNSFAEAAQAIQSALQIGTDALDATYCPDHLDTAFFLMREYLHSTTSGPQGLISNLTSAYERLSNRRTDGEWYEEFTDELENLCCELDGASGRLEEIAACIEYADRHAKSTDVKATTEKSKVAQREPTEGERQRLRMLQSASSTDIHILLQERLRMSLSK